MRMLETISVIPAYSFVLFTLSLFLSFFVVAVFA